MEKRQAGREANRRHDAEGAFNRESVHEFVCLRVAGNMNCPALRRFLRGYPAT
jgi:hypothetical protein